jgi:hypothetical protein
LIEWFASKDIENIEDASSAGRVGPFQHWQQQEEAQKQISLLILPLPRLAESGNARGSDSG